MSRSIEHISVFIASPSDVSKERISTNSVIDELNIILASARDQHLDLVGWETHTRPSISTDPQQAINDQIDDDHDIVIGIFWTRIGSPTPRAQSGTLEEIERAIAKWEKDASSIDIMIYFKNSGLPLSQINTDQLRKLMEFKASLGARGVLYREFEEQDYEGVLRSDLARALSQRSTRHASSPTVISTVKSAAILFDDASSSVDEDAGYEDLAAEAVADLGQVAAIMERIVDITNDATSRSEARYSNLGSAIDQTSRLRVIEGLSNDFQQYSAALVREAGQLGFYQDRGLGALAKSILIMSEDGALDANTGQSLLDRVRESQETLKTFDQTLDRVRASFLSMPRSTRQLNAAKRNVGSALDLLRTKIQTACRIQESIETTLLAATDKPEK